MADLEDREMSLRAQLLPDDERARLAQLARDLDNLPAVDADVPVTPCPEWCEIPDHAETREGRWHAGAVTAVKVNDTHTLSCEVIHGSDGFTEMDMSLDVFGEGSGLTVEQAREFAAGILRAADLLERLTS